MEIISRARWGARFKNGFAESPLPARELWLHHSVTIAPDLVWVDADGDGVEDDEERAMRTLEEIGQQRFNGGISYTFAVMPSGRIYEGHGVDRQGAHTGGRNDIARAVVLVGDYSTRQPTEAQRRAVAWLVRHGRAAGWWTVSQLSGGHRQAPNQIATACPGDAGLAAISEINRLAVSGEDLEEDMPTADEIATAVVNKWLATEVNRSYDPDEPAATGKARIEFLLASMDGHTGGVKDLLRKLHAKVDAGFANLSDDEAKLLAEIRKMPTGGQVDVEQLAAQLRGSLGDALADELAERLAGSNA